MLRSPVPDHSKAVEAAWRDSEMLLERRVAELRNEVKKWENWSDVLLQVHAHMDLRATCYALANEFRRVADCDRVTVLCRRGTRLRAEAVSGLETFDRRSPVIQVTEQLARDVSHDNQPWWYAEGQSRDELRPARLDAYLDRTHARACGIVPLHARTESDKNRSEAAVGVLVFERFEQRPFSAAEQQGLEILGRHASVAVSRAARTERLPLLFLSRGLGRLTTLASPGSRLVKATLVVLVLGLLAAAALWPVEFTIRASGVIQPAQRRDIFAPADGLVREIRVAEGAAVAAGDLLLELHNDDLELDITRISGELQTAQRQLQAIQASRLEALKPVPGSRDARSQLAAEEERLKEVIRGLELQQEQRLKQRDDLHIRSPIDGQLLTWDVERLLRGRPLRRGQRLMSVANVKGEWLLEMRVADHDVGHVVRAVQQTPQPISVRFRMASEPDREHLAVLSKISDWTDAHDQEGPSVQMTAQVLRSDQVAVRPGAKVVAQIHLGERPRAYVWLRDLIEFVRIRAWF